MTYTRLDDRWDEHPHYVGLELEHFGLMACALTYANRQLTDGFIPSKAVRNFGRVGKGNTRAAEHLVSLGIWIRVDGGYQIDGFLELGVTNARTEGHNRVIKQVKRVACGFRNQANYERRIMLHSAARRAARTISSQDPRTAPAHGRRARSPRPGPGPGSPGP